MTVLNSMSDLTRTRQRMTFAPEQVAEVGLLAANSNSRRKAWNSAIDAMLKWKSNADFFSKESRPNQESLNAAIRFANDRMAQSALPPSSITPTPDGDIAIEWHQGKSTQLWVFLNSDQVEFTALKSNQVVHHFTGWFDQLKKTLKIRVATDDSGK